MIGVEIRGNVMITFSRLLLISCALALPFVSIPVVRAADADADKDAKAEKSDVKDSKDSKDAKDAKDSKDAKAAKPDKDAKGAKADADEKGEKGKEATTKKSGAGDAKALTAAVTALGKEYDLFSKDPIKNPLRADANYFKDNPTDASAADIIAVLDKPIKGADKKGEAYVKWQLTGALPEKLDPKDEQKLLKIYDKAPGPIPRPGAGKEEQAKLNGQIAHLGKNQEFEFNEKYLDAVSKAQAVNAPILAYRNALYQRLPASYDTYAAGFKDVYGRYEAGLDTEPLMGQIISGVETWSIDAKQNELANMHKLVSALAAEPPPDVYTGVKGGEKGGYVWLKSQSKLDEGGRLTALVKTLEERGSKGGNAGGGAGGGGAGMKKAGGVKGK
jgi:hypothetical protein